MEVTVTLKFDSLAEANAYLAGAGNAPAALVTSSAPKAESAPSQPTAAEGEKRGPGRPPGSKNKPKDENQAAAPAESASPAPAPTPEPAPAPAPAEAAKPAADYNASGVGEAIQAAVKAAGRDKVLAALGQFKQADGSPVGKGSQLQPADWDACKAAMVALASPPDDGDLS